MANTLTTEEIWLAGVLEGDGSFGLHKNGPGSYIPAIRLAMLDKDVVERFANLFGANVNSYLTPKGDKVMWRCYIYKREKVQPFLLKIYKTMSNRRKGQISEMLNWLLQNPVIKRTRSQEVCDC